MNRDLDPEGPTSLWDHDDWDRAVSSFFNKWLWLILGAVILYSALQGNFNG